MKLLELKEQEIFYERKRKIVIRFKDLLHRRAKVVR